MADEDPLILDVVNGRVLDGADLDEYYAGGFDEYEPTDWEGIDLEDLFDLPPVLLPVRLPEEAELVVQARRSALLADLRALADEVRGTTVHAAAVDVVLLRLAEEAELVERDGEDLVPGEYAGWLDDLADDSDALEATLVLVAPGAGQGVVIQLTCPKSRPGRKDEPDSSVGEAN